MVDLKISEYGATTPQDADNVVVERLGAPPNLKVSMAALLAFINNSNSIDADQIMGRPVGAGNGPVVPLTGAQVMTIIGDALDIINDVSPELGAALNANGFGIFGLTTLSISRAATADGDHVLDIHVDADGFGGVDGIHLGYESGNIGATNDEAAMHVNIDKALALGGTICALAALATNGPATAYGIGVSPGVNPILQFSGIFVDMDSALVLAVDRLTEFITSDPAGPNNVEIFVADDDTITIGGAAKFSAMEINLETGASGAGISPVFEYSTGIGTWATFSPVDGTSGFQHSGVIFWFLTGIPNWLVGTGGEFLIRITRTRNSLATVPKEDTIQIAATTIYTWDENGDLIVNKINGGTPASLDLPNEWTARQNFNAVPLTGLGVDLVTDGGFPDNTNWTEGAGWLIGSGVASCDGTQGADSDLTQTPSIGPITSGKTYQVTFTVSNYSAGNVAPVAGDVEGTDRAANGTFVENIIAGAGGDIDLRADSAFIGDIDNVIVKLANVSWDLDVAQIATLTLDGDLVLDNPTNMKDGAQPLLRLNQSGAGGFTLLYGTAYKFSNDIHPTLSTSPTARDKIGFDCTGVFMDGNFVPDYS